MKKYVRLVQLVLIYFSILLLYYLIQKDFTESITSETVGLSGGVISETIVQNPDTLDGVYPVHSVVDGDTIKVMIQGKSTTIRILGIDTPEIYTTRTGYTECYGEEASNFAKKTLSGALVRLEWDNTQDKKDKYGRVLAHVFFSGGLYYQEESIKNGYGFRYVYRQPTKYDDRLQLAENQAKIQKVWVWAKCDGMRKEIKK